MPVICTGLCVCGGGGEKFPPCHPRHMIKRRVESWKKEYKGNEDIYINKTLPNSYINVLLLYYTLFPSCSVDILLIVITTIDHMYHFFFIIIFFFIHVFFTAQKWWLNSGTVWTDGGLLANGERSGNLTITTLEHWAQPKLGSHLHPQTGGIHRSTKDQLPARLPPQKKTKRNWYKKDGFWY